MTHTSDFTGRQRCVSDTPSTLCALHTHITKDALHERPPDSQSAAGIARKRAVNLTLNTGLVAEAKLLSPNLSATVESLLEGFVTRERQSRLNRQQLADQCANDWNSVLDAHGSFADSHSTL